MLSFIAALMLGTASAQPMHKVLLDCNMSSGVDQEFQVIRNLGGLVLRELTDRGAWVQRPLLDQEWRDRRFQLRPDLTGEHTLVTFEKGQWIYRSSSIEGVADCF
jgi:hypothetical protein